MKNSLIISLMFLTLTSHAQWITGNKLHEQFNSSETSQIRAAATGYVIGVVDSWDGIVFCTPDNATIGQLSDTVKDYIAKNPSQRHKSGRELVNSALRSAFPCSPSRK